MARTRPEPDQSASFAAMILLRIGRNRCRCCAEEDREHAGAEEGDRGPEGEGDDEGHAAPPCRLRRARVTPARSAEPRQGARTPSVMIWT